MKKSHPKIEVTIESLSNSGDGVARYDNKVIFIPFALPGERVEAEIILNKKTFSKGRLNKVLEKSKHRIKPTCSVFGRCGGCDWQNLDYNRQLYWKQKNLIDVLQRIANIPAGEWLEDIHPAFPTFNYRNRIQIHIDSRGPFYFSKGSQTPVYIEQCPIAQEAINNWLQNNTLQQSDKRKIKIEVAEMSDGSIGTFPVDDKGQSALGFRQVNDRQNSFLCQVIASHVKKHKISNLVDLYCGQGNWSLSLANQLPFIQCRGIDNNPTNIKNAKSLAPGNCQFVLGDALSLLTESSDQQEMIIIDPPRVGCSPAVIENLIKNPPDWLIYISCHPATMARDLKVLLESQWQIHRMLPVDMFPQTAHLECMTILRSANPAKTANC